MSFYEYTIDISSQYFLFISIRIVLKSKELGKEFSIINMYGRMME